MKNVTTRILLVCAALGVAFGALGLGNTVLMGALALAAPPFYPVLSGVYLLPGVVAASLLRKPGAALIVQTIAGLVTLGASSAVMAPTLAFILYGVIIEVAHLVLRYRVWTVWPVLVAAALVGLLGAVSSFAILGGDQLPPVAMIAAPIAILAATLLWAALGLVIATALRRTGVGSLPTYPAPASRGSATAD